MPAVSVGRTFAFTALTTLIVLWIATPLPTVPVGVRWRDGVSNDVRIRLEQTFSLEDGEHTEGRTWRYSLADISHDNLQSLVTHPDVEDTAGIDRRLFVSDTPIKGRREPLVLWSVSAGLIAALIHGIWLLRNRQYVTLATIASVATIVAAVTLTYWPVLTSGNRIMFNADFFQYVSRHESVTQGIWRYHTLPLRAYWLGGGFNTIADPEDPTLNPLVALSVALGGVNGIKAIGYFALLIGALSTYALARRILDYTQWGALYSALVFGTCLFLPSRMAGGNPNEVYGAWLPLCLLLLGLALTGRRAVIALLGFVFYTMLSDGKLTALMAMLYIALLCVFATVPSLRIFGREQGTLSALDYRPVVRFATALGLTVLIGLPRLLPAFDVIARHGGIVPMIAAHPQHYNTEGVNAYSFDELWKGVIGFGRGINAETLNRDLVTVGILPVILSGIAMCAFGWQAIPWAAVLFLFSWLILAHHAPFDLLKVLWTLPVFDAIYRPYKYFSFQIAFTLAILAGRPFDLLRQLHSRGVEAVIALLLIAFSVAFLQPRSMAVLGGAFIHDDPALTMPAGFFNVDVASTAHAVPLRAVAYFNLRHDIGTMRGFTPVPERTAVTPKYFIDADDHYVSNPDYRGEAYFDEGERAGTVGAPAFEPNRIAVPVNLAAPGTLVINQNYDRYWSADAGSVSDHHGLIGLRLTRTGTYTVHLRYTPWPFVAGIVLTSIGIAGLAFREYRRSTLATARAHSTTTSAT
jgi:hypothetical protein